MNTVNQIRSSTKKVFVCLVVVVFALTTFTGCSSAPTTTTYVTNQVVHTINDAIETSVEAVTQNKTPLIVTVENEGMDKTLIAASTKPQPVVNKEANNTGVEETITETAQEEYVEESSADYSQDYSSYESSPKTYDLYCRYHGESQTEVDAGGIVEYYDNYYASHWYDEGAIFYEFEPGTIVNIDGKTVQIEGSYYSDYTVETIEHTYDVIGWDKVCFQTCLGDGTEIVIYYGSQI